MMTTYNTVYHWKRHSEEDFNVALDGKAGNGKDSRWSAAQIAPSAIGVAGAQRGRLVYAPFSSNSDSSARTKRQRC